MSKALSTEEFIQKAKSIHGDKYNYSKVNYINAHTKIIIICPKHGEFYQTPNSHLIGRGCTKCSHIYQNSSKEFIQRIQKIIGNTYNYSKVNYINSKTKICIICSEHGEFCQLPSNLIKGNGCPHCSYIKFHNNTLNKRKQNFINQVQKIHDNKYNYSKMEYKGTHNKICIICNKHGKFWQTPHNHLQGQGCPNCQRSLGEEQIKLWLHKHNIQYEMQKTFHDCKGKRKLLPFDFYLPYYNICIEYDGIQHFKPVKRFEGIQGFQRTQLHDQIKNQYCHDNNIKLLRIPYIDFKNINQILNDYI